MKNIQYLSVSGGSWEYYCKYVGHIEKNHCTVTISDDVGLIRRAICFAHYTTDDSGRNLMHQTNDEICIGENAKVTQHDPDFRTTM